MLVQDFYSAYNSRDYDELEEGAILARGRKAVQEYIKRNRDVTEFKPLLERHERELRKIAKRKESRSRPKAAPKPKAERKEAKTESYSLVGLWSDGLLVRTFDPKKMKPEKILEAWKLECQSRPYEHLELGELHPLRGRTGTLGVRKAASPLGRAYERPHLRWNQGRTRDVKSWDLSTKVHTMGPRRF